ncbi:MAG: TIGR02300 family protein [Alphaproteobacteria bacterium]|nr:TIGR02300 family protein [Alphaproteobacteria bacterium]MCD8519925.1 TIGR02300 family protein [Alphaproteobacteria bacterium]MCD8526062.1 TIGR02300 family protein [Alphaproteobacteria bacterium]MCD8570948.1 TIGR02300 family protein [Alphaproteobacteria bacterium]
MTLALDPRGLKRICMSCGTRFYDMNNRPIVCPNCETEFTGEIKVKTRRSRAAVVNDALAEETKKKVVEDEGDIEVDDDLVSLDDVAEGDDGDDVEDDEADPDLDMDAEDLADIDDLDDDDGMGDEDDDLDIDADLDEDDR